jgi:hypothetical protein
MNTTEGLRRFAVAAAFAAAGMLPLAGSARAQMVTGAAGFNGGYNNAGTNANGGFNRFPDEENGPVNAQTTDLNAPNLVTGAGVPTSPSSSSVFTMGAGVSGALDTFSGAGDSSNLTNLSVDTSQNGSSAGSSNNANGN